MINVNEWMNGCLIMINIDKRCNNATRELIINNDECRIMTCEWMANIDE